MWDHLAPMRSRFPQTRWMRPDLFHLTLVFLGETDADRVPALVEGLNRVAGRHAPYQTNVGGAGGHIDDRPGARRGGVAWLTLAEGFAQTAGLALDADSTIASHTHDARRQPLPHLTVARAIDATTLAALRDFAASTTLGWTTERLVLFRSYLGPGGSRYQELAGFSLSASSPVDALHAARLDSPPTE